MNIIRPRWTGDRGSFGLGYVGDLTTDITTAQAVISNVTKLFGSNSGLHAVRAQEATTALQAALTAPATIIKDENGASHGTALQFLVYEAGNAATAQDKGYFRTALASYYSTLPTLLTAAAAQVLNSASGGYTPAGTYSANLTSPLYAPAPSTATVPGSGILGTTPTINPATGVATTSSTIAGLSTTTVLFLVGGAVLLTMLSKKKGRRA